MEELLKLQNINISGSICEGLEILFSHVLAETKSEYGFYMIRYSPDKEWLIPELYFEDRNTKNINQNIILKSEILNKYHLAKSISFINEKLKDNDIKCFQIPNILLHPNIQVILIIINFKESEENPNFFKCIIDRYIPLFCVHFLKKYIEDITNENTSHIMKTISKIKAPINEIIEFADQQDDIKKSALLLAIIINDLVDIHKLNRNKLQLVREETQIRAMFKEIADISNFNFSIDDDIPEVLFIDVKRFKQILLGFICDQSHVYVIGNIVIGFDENDNEKIHWELEISIDPYEKISEERLFITKKLIGLMGGYLSLDPNVTKFTIEAYKDKNSYVDNVLKFIKNKKILIVDAHENIRHNIGHRLQKWGLDVILASNEIEGMMYLDESKNKIDLFIIGVINFIEKIKKFTIHKPCLQIIEAHHKEITHKNEYLSFKDTTPINSPRSRKSSVIKPQFLIYPIDDLKLLDIIIDVLN